MLIRLPATRRSAAMAHCRRWYRARSCRRLRLGAPARASAGTAAAPVEPAQGRRPGAREALDRLLAASAVDVLVGNLPHPPPEMRFQRRPADERVTGDRIAFDVTDAALVFSLGARSVWSTGPRPEIPVIAKAASRSWERTSRFAASWRSASAGIVEQHLACHPAKVAERCLDAVEPCRLPIM